MKRSMINLFLLGVVAASGCASVNRNLRKDLCSSQKFQLDDQSMEAICPIETDQALHLTQTGEIYYQFDSEHPLTFEPTQAIDYVEIRGLIAPMEYGEVAIVVNRDGTRQDLSNNFPEKLTIYTVTKFVFNVESFGGGGRISRSYAFTPRESSLDQTLSEVPGIYVEHGGGLISLPWGEDHRRVVITMEDKGIKAILRVLRREQRETARNASGQALSSSEPVHWEHGYDGSGQGKFELIHPTGKNQAWHLKKNNEKLYELDSYHPLDFEVSQPLHWVIEVREFIGSITPAEILVEVNGKRDSSFSIDRNESNESLVESSEIRLGRPIWSQLIGYDDPVVRHVTVTMLTPRARAIVRVINRIEAAASN